MNLKTLLAIITALLLTNIKFASATEYSKTVTFPDYVCGQDYSGAGKLISATYYYNSVNQRFHIDYTVEECNGVLPDGLFFVMSSGPNPKGVPGELAIIYTSWNQKYIAAYAYNGRTSVDSYYDGDGVTAGFQLPDRIFNSIDNPKNIISWTQSESGTAPSRRVNVKLVLDGRVINSHKPLYQQKNDIWNGIAFADLMGTWFHPVAGTKIELCGDNNPHPACAVGPQLQPSRTLNPKNFIRLFSVIAQSWYDGNNVPTIKNELPLCSFKTSLGSVDPREQKCLKVKAGQHLEAFFRGSDADDKALVVNYSGHPENAKYSAKSGSKGATPYTLEMSWLPSLKQTGTNFSMNVSFTDSKTLYPGECKLPICVTKNVPPQCKIQSSIGAQGQCTGRETRVNFTSKVEDLDSKSLKKEWKVVCATDSSEFVVAANVSQDLGSAEIVLGQPGQGLRTKCRAELSVSDEVQSVTCASDIVVEACKLDCLNVPNGTAQLDQCGVCNGNNACLGCDNVPNSGKVLDNCGVCGGNNACVDCNGVANGTAVDDNCGVCNGDGKSCLVCDSSDLSPIQTRMDNGAKQQARQINVTLKPIKRIDSAGSYFKSTSAQALSKSNANWAIAWSIPSNIKQCLDSPACVDVSNVSVLSTYESNSLELMQLNIAAAKKVRQFRVAEARELGQLTARAKRLLRKEMKQRVAVAEAQHKSNLVYKNEIPLKYSNCE